MATKRELDKLLKRLQDLQRKCFQKDSKVELEIHPRQDKDGYSICVMAYNEDKVHQFDTDENGNPEFCNFESFFLYSLYSNDRNEAEVDMIVRFLDMAEDEQR